MAAHRSVRPMVMSFIPLVLAIGLLALSVWLGLRLDWAFMIAVLALWIFSARSTGRPLLMIGLVLYLVFMYGVYSALGWLHVPVWASFAVFAHLLFLLSALLSWASRDGSELSFDGLWSLEMMLAGSLALLGTISLLKPHTVLWSVIVGSITAVAIFAVGYNLNGKMRDIIELLLTAVEVGVIVRLLTPVLPEGVVNFISFLLSGGSEPLTPQMAISALRHTDHFMAWASPVGTVILGLLLLWRVASEMSFAYVKACNRNRQNQLY